MIDPRGRAMKLTPHGIVTASLIGPLEAMDEREMACLAQELEAASAALRDEDIHGALWPLGRALKMLGFTVEKPDEGI